MVIHRFSLGMIFGVGTFAWMMLSLTYFQLATDKNVSIDSYLSNNHSWNHRLFNHPGIGNWSLPTNSFDMLYSSLLAIEDWIEWNLVKAGKFEVHSYYEALMGTLGASFPHKSIWQVKVPKDCFLCVELSTRQNFSTMDNLWKCKHDDCQLVLYVQDWWRIGGPPFTSLYGS